MTLDEFVNKWNGKPCDFDGSYGNQCVDLYRMYVKEVLNKPQTPPVAGAKDIWNSCPGFTKIPNAPDNFPLPGDVMIWGSKYGPYGHVAIVTKADINTFTCFSQNDPVGTLPVVKTYKAWSSLLGWLRPEGEVMSDIYKGLDLNNKDSMKECVDIRERLMSGDLVDKKKLDEALSEGDKARNEAKGFREELNSFVADLARIFDTRQEKPEIIAAAKQAIEYEDKYTEAQAIIKSEREKHTEELQALRDELTRVKSDLATSRVALKEANNKMAQLEIKLNKVQNPPTIVKEPNFWKGVLWLKQIIAGK